MPQQVSIDDTNTTLIQYTGTWESIVDIPQQWDGTSHGSLDPGASATFGFRGYQVWIWGTIPAGTCSSHYDVAIDGGPPNATSRTSNGSAIYNDVYFQSDLLVDTYHTIILRNLGSSESQNSELQLDRFMFQTDERIPPFEPPEGPTMSSPTLTTPSTSLTSNAGYPSSNSKAVIITCSLIGVLLVVVINLAFSLWKSRRAPKTGENNKVAGICAHRPTLTPVPFLLISPERPSPGTHLVADNSTHPSTSTPSACISEMPGHSHQVSKGPVTMARSSSPLRPVSLIEAHSSDHLPATGTSTALLDKEESMTVPPPAYNGLQM